MLLKDLNVLFLFVNSGLVDGLQFLVIAYLLLIVLFIYYSESSCALIVFAYSKHRVSHDAA